MRAQAVDLTDNDYALPSLFVWPPLDTSPRDASQGGDTPLTHSHTLSWDEKSLMLPQCISVIQPAFALQNTCPRLKTICKALNTAICFDFDADDEEYVSKVMPWTALLKDQEAYIGFRKEPPPDIMIVTTCMPLNPWATPALAQMEHPHRWRATTDMLEVGKFSEMHAGFPYAANCDERTLYKYRKYADNFIKTVQRKYGLGADATLPLYVVFNDFHVIGHNLACELNKGLELGAQFIKCPPTEATQVRFVRSVDALLGIDFADPSSQPRHLIINMFEFHYPLPIFTQVTDYDVFILERFVHAHYVAILALIGCFKVGLVGYPQVYVPEGSLLIFPARFWFYLQVRSDDCKTLTLVF